MNMHIAFRTLMAPVAISALLAAGSANAQSYGNYADHQVDMASTLSASFQNVVNNAWVNLSSVTANGVSGLTGTGGFPGTSAWSGKTSQIDSAIGDAGGTLGGATLSKVSNGSGGGPYAAGGSLYFGGFSADVNNNGGTLVVTDSSPLSGLQTIAFQAGFGEAWTYDFYNHALPTLSYTTASGTVSNVAATSSQIAEAFFNGTVSMPTGDENVYINQHLLQWDLSGVNEAITSFSITFTGVQHAQLYGLTLTQAAAPTAVPEPSTYALLLSGVIAMGALKTRRRRS
jgi:hypothetical protein